MCSGSRGRRDWEAEGDSSVIESKEHPLKEANTAGAGAPLGASCVVRHIAFTSEGTVRCTPSSLTEGQADTHTHTHTHTN